MSFHLLSQARPFSHRRQGGIPFSSLPADPFLSVLAPLPLSRPFQRPPSAPGAGWSPGSPAQAGTACELPSSLAPWPAAPAALPAPHGPPSGAGGPGGAAPHTPGPCGGSAARTAPAAKRSRPDTAGVPLPLHPHLPRVKHPFPRAGHEGRAAQPRILGLTSAGAAPSAAPGLPPPDGTGMPLPGRPSAQLSSAQSAQLGSGRVAETPREGPVPSPSPGAAAAPRERPHPRHCRSHPAASGFLIPTGPLKIALRIFTLPPRSRLATCRSLCPAPGPVT